MRPLPPLDLALLLACIAGLVYVIVRLAATVIPLQVKEAKVVNGLAKLRKQLLISGSAVLAAASIACVILTLALFIPGERVVTEILLLCFVGAFVVIAEAKHAIYHQQYTPEHKAISRKIAEEEAKAHEASERP